MKLRESWRRAASIVCALLCGVAGSAQAIWPQFRGPNGSGVSTLAPPPDTFGPTTHRLWSAPVPPGHSSPVLAGDRVFLTAVDGGELHTLAFDRASGRLLWKRAAPAAAIEKVHEFASPAASTPLADGQRVIVYLGSFGLLCYDPEGRELWRRPLPTPQSTYGTSSSPIRVGTNVVVLLDSNDRASRLLAVSLADGTTAWETPRPLASSGWSTPMVWDHGDRSEIVVLGARRLTGYDSQSGRDLWWVDGYSPETIGVPVAGDGLLFVSSSGLAGPPSEGYETMSWGEMVKLDRDGDGRVQKAEVPEGFRYTLRPELPADHPGRHLPHPFRAMFDGVDGDRDGALTESEFTAFVKQWGARAAPSLKAIRPGGSGDVKNSHVAWQVSRGIPEIPSPLFLRGRVYLARDGGFLTCVRAATGELLFQERVGAPGSYCASPVAAGDRLLVASHNGVVVTIDAGGEELVVLARNDLGERIWATPALGDGSLYVRTEKHLFAFGAASTPGSGKEASLPFESEIRAFAEADRAEPPVRGGVLFVGSSIFRQWTNAAAAVAPLPALNRAFGGSRTGDQLTRFDQVVRPYAPRVIVYYCGSNDLKAGDDPEAIFGRFRAFARRVADELPGTRLVYVSSTRSPDRVDKWDRVDRYNALVRDHCRATPGHVYVDINPVLVDADGRPRLDFYQEDRLHLRPAAYAALARVLQPVIEREWLKVR